MKLLRLSSLLFLGLAFLFTACQKDRFDVDSLTDFPPGILSIFPTPDGKVTVGDFDVTVVFADGTTSPLASGSITLKDADGNTLGSTTGSLSGTRDSLTLAGSEFDAANLPVGFYTIDISVTDVNGQTTDRSTSFELSLLPFAANHDEMYIAGAFNGWGADDMELVADHIWEIRGIDLQGNPWKFKNCFDWCDEDWGDADCNGIMESNMGPGGNGDTDCGFSGQVNVRFNDQTLTYTVEQTVTFASNVSGLYLLGTFNVFQGEDFPFTLVDDNTWVLNDVLLMPGDAFRFAEMPDFMGKNFGDAEGDGIAEEFGPNIVFGMDAAYYTVTFNDQTLAYSFEFERFPSIGIIGDATPGGWDTDTDLTDNGDGTYSIEDLELTDGEAKFRANDDWAQNWGGADFPIGIGTQDGPNIPVVAGVYDITFTPETGEYVFELDAGIVSLGIIGDATPGGWDTDTDLADPDGDGIYTLLLGLSDGNVKFRVNDTWDDLNWGGSDFPMGTGVEGGSDIAVTAGLYLISFNTETAEYNFEAATVGIIGSATPGGWDSDTDLNFDAANPNVLTLNLTLADGEAKFRVNDVWTILDWGGDTFPTGTGVIGGPNIPITAGTYDISFNVLTAEYSFD